MKIGLLGCGVVGSGVKDIIDAKFKDIQIVKILVKDESEITEERMTCDVNELINSDIDLIVECIGGVDIPLKYITMALEVCKSVVSSNKKVIANHYKDFIRLAERKNVNFAFEASVGGGIPWMENIRHTKRIDEINSFEGIFNGTTNYILDKMTTQGEDFDLVLKEAQKLGYAENDPTDDIDGYDVKFKVALSANSIWNTNVDLDKILFWGIRNISKKDIDYAKATNSTIKLIGQGRKNKNGLDLFVIPTFVKNSENIAHIPNNLNCTKLNSEYLGESSYIGQGAGKFPTAHAVVQDIISIFEKRDINTKILENLDITNDFLSTFYIRKKNLEGLEDIILEKISDDTIITKKISLKELSKIAKENTFIAEMK